MWIFVNIIKKFLLCALILDANTGASSVYNPERVNHNGLSFQEKVFINEYLSIAIGDSYFVLQY